MNKIYFDNAATSWPKPQSVLDAMIHYQKELGANAGRGVYYTSIETSRMVFELREKLADMFGINDSRRVIFTLNTTHAINMAFKCFLKAGDHVVTTTMEHNAVARPLAHMAAYRRVSYTAIPADDNGTIDPGDVKKNIKKKTRLVCIIHASNVFGSINDIREIGRICENAGVPLMVDAAQTAGSIPIDVVDMNISFLALPGHKGLLGPTGTGALYVSPNIRMETWVEGGTGTSSGSILQPESWPDYLEAGTANLIGLAGLTAAIDFVNKTTVTAMGKHKTGLTDYFLGGIRKIDRIRVYGSATPAGTVSIKPEAFPCNELAVILERDGNIMVRSGLHCAPWAHRAMGTADTGTLRFSFGYYNTKQEINCAFDIISKAFSES